MQQIGAGLASIAPVESYRLPVPARNAGGRALVNARTVWVLHKRVFVRGIAAVLCCVLIVLAYNIREGIGAAAGVVSEMLQGEFADAGFAIGEIKISGQALTPESDVLAALGLQPKTSTLNFDVAAALARLQDLPSVASATVRKIYPDQVVVTITEKVPVARWRVDGVTFVVDAKGEQIGEDEGAYVDLPLVIGDGAADNALVMIRVMEKYPELFEGLVALSRIGDRRWDMIYESGLRVQLPEIGVAQALAELNAYQSDYQLLDRDITLVDMRVEGMIALRPTLREEDGDEGKKKKPVAAPQPQTAGTLL